VGQGPVFAPASNQRTNKKNSKVIGMSKFIARFAKDESGATAIEYGLIVALIAVVVITAFTTIGNNLNTKVKAVADAVAWQ
jgi:pilus assembly protein Flp/PilA